MAEAELVVGVGIEVYFELGIDTESEVESGLVVVADRSVVDRSEAEAEVERYWVECCFAEENRKRFAVGLR